MPLKQNLGGINGEVNGLSGLQCVCTVISNAEMRVVLEVGQADGKRGKAYRDLVVEAR